VLGARAAKRAGLIDRVGTLETALTSASKKAPRRQEKRQMKNLLGALGLGADAQDDEIESAAVKAFDAYKVQIEAEKAATEAAKVAAAELANELATARKALADIAAKADADKRAAIVDEAVKAGKLAPAKRDEIAAKGEQHGTEWLAALVEAMPVVAPSKAPVAAVVPAASNELTPRELAMCVEMGIDPKVYSAKKAATKGKD
jgi:phage I-like protein